MMTHEQKDSYDKLFHKIKNVLIEADDTMIGFCAMLGVAEILLDGFGQDDNPAMKQQSQKLGMLVKSLGAQYSGDDIDMTMHTPDTVAEAMAHHLQCSRHDVMEFMTSKTGCFVSLNQEQQVWICGAFITEAILAVMQSSPKSGVRKDG